MLQIVNKSEFARKNSRLVRRIDSPTLVGSCKISQDANGCMISWYDVIFGKPLSQQVNQILPLSAWVNRIWVCKSSPTSLPQPRPNTYK